MASAVVLQQRDVAVALDRLAVEIGLALDRRIDVGQHVD
jgi:hypothetical protein